MKVIVEFEIDTSKVGKAWFEHRLNENFPMDEYIQVKNIKGGHEGWN